MIATYYIQAVSKLVLTAVRQYMMNFTKKSNSCYLGATL